MTTPAIRDARRSDVPAVVALEAACFARREERYRAIVVHGLVARRSAIALVAMDGPRCAAWAGGTIRCGRAGKRGRVSAVAVHPSHRGCGLGARVLAALMARMQVGGADGIALEVREDNLAARSLYERHGFVVVERLPDWYAPEVDAVRMRRG